MNYSSLCKNINKQVPKNSAHFSSRMRNISAQPQHLHTSSSPISAAQSNTMSLFFSRCGVAFASIGLVFVFSLNLFVSNLHANSIEENLQLELSSTILYPTVDFVILSEEGLEDWSLGTTIPSNF